jgi:hypothetical protein
MAPEDKATKSTYDEDMPSPQAPLVAAGVTLLLLRGVLLWVLIPVATCVWMIIRTVGRHRQLGLGQFLGWADLNLAAGLQRTALRPLFASPARWTAWSEVGNVTHRVRLFDPV